MWCAPRPREVYILCGIIRNAAETCRIALLSTYLNGANDQRAEAIASCTYTNISA